MDEHREKEKKKDGRRVFLSVYSGSNWIIAFSRKCVGSVLSKSFSIPGETLKSHQWLVGSIDIKMGLGSNYTNALWVANISLIHIGVLSPGVYPAVDLQATFDEFRILVAAPEVYDDGN